MIDEKGRLFGKINIVDLLVILVVVIAAAVLGMKFLRPGSSTNTAGGATAVTYTVVVENVRPEVYENVQKYVPSTLMASGELLDGQVVAVTATPHMENVVLNTESGTQLVQVEQKNLDLTFTVECNVLNTITTEIGTQEVRVGKTHIVKTDKFELVGVVSDCSWENGAA